MLSIKKHLFLFLWWLRNSKINHAEKLLLSSDLWNEEEYDKWQERKLIELVQHAYARSSYYKEIIDKASIDVSTFRFSDLSRLPATSKESLLKNGDKIQNYIEGEKHFKSETSGSTGQPLVFYRNAEWDAFHRASIYRGLYWHGVRPYDRNVYFWGYRLGLKERTMMRFFDWLQNRVRVFSYDDKDIGRIIDELSGAKFVSGYSSGIYRLAKEANRRGKAFNLNLVKGTSEKIYDEYHGEAARAFGKSIVSEYGAAEAGIIAFECEKGSMHVNSETCIVEVVDGKILVTNLYSKAFPIIRYSLGDYVEIDEGKCGCGRQRPIIKEVTGRVGGVVFGSNMQFPSLVLYYIFKDIALSQGKNFVYQGVQDEKGFLTLRIFSEVTKEDSDLILRYANSYFKNDMQVVVLPNCELPKDQKLKDFVSGF